MNKIYGLAWDLAMSDKLIQQIFIACLYVSGTVLDSVPVFKLSDQWKRCTKTHCLALIRCVKEDDRVGYR